MDELQQVASLNKARVICLTETWLSSNIQDMAFTIPDYSIFRSDRVNRDAGGVCAYISNSIPCKRLADYNYHLCNVEPLWLSLRPHSLPRNVSTILLGIIYHSTACREPENQVLCEHIQRVVDSFLTKYNNAMVIITGDFNPASTRLDLSRISRPNNLKQMVNFYTRDSGMLDCFFRNRASLFELSRLPKIAASDHYVILANCSLPKKINDPTCKIKLRDLRASNWRAFGEWITTMDWKLLYAAPSCSEKLVILMDELTTAMDIYFPFRSVRIHIQDKPWITGKLKYYTSKRQQVFTRFGKDSVVYKF